MWILYQLSRKQYAELLVIARYLAPNLSAENRMVKYAKEIFKRNPGIGGNKTVSDVVIRIYKNFGPGQMDV